MKIAELETKSREDLAIVAKELGVGRANALTKQDLIFNLLQVQPDTSAELLRGGILEVVDDCYGFLRHRNLLPGNADIYVSQSQIRRFGLRTGDLIAGRVRTPKDSEKYQSLLQVDTVNGLDPEKLKNRPVFEDLTPVFPDEHIVLETTTKNLTARLMDLISPIGRGQRGLIVSPPKAGKTMVLKDIAHGIKTNAPDIKLIIALIGERPEEVTDMIRSVDAEVVASTFDDPVEDHTRVAEMALDRAKRLVEGGLDVAILLDSITRLSRAYNLAMPTSGRTLSGGLDPVALYPPKRFFGAARNIEGGGSLTIIATCIIDTGSRMDDVIYEEFKGTGNMELHLDRKLAERRIFPALDVARSSTRREELLLDAETLKQSWLVRRMIAMVSNNSQNPTEATERMIAAMGKTKTNQEFLAILRDI